MLFTFLFKFLTHVIQFFCHCFFAPFCALRKELLPLKDNVGEKNPIQIVEKVHSFLKHKTHIS